MESVTKLLDLVLADMEQIDRHIDELRNMGYDQRIELAGGKLVCLAYGEFFHCRELMVDHIYHVHGICYVYGIRHCKINLKGIFVCYTSKTISSH